jgi:alcohol dehydrogenase class IV
VIDAGKAIAALAANPGDPLDYLEVVGRGQPLAHAALPMIAVPTTAGTGAEVTRNAVLAVPESQVKVSLRSLHMLPRVALVDPSLTLDLPPAQTAASGIDALTQLIEPYLSCRANAFVDALCRDAIPRAAWALPAVLREPRNATARAAMSFAALQSGHALANAGLGAVHGFAGPIGGMFPAPHGAVCAALLPHVLRANLTAMRTRAPQHPALARMAEIGQWLTGEHSASAEDAVDWCAALVRDLAIPSLHAWGVRHERVANLVAMAARASSMKGNPLPLTEDELSHIVEAAM